MFSLKTKKNLLKLDQKTGLFKNKKFFVEIFFLLLVGGGNSNVGDDVDDDDDVEPTSLQTVGQRATTWVQLGRSFLRLYCDGAKITTLRCVRAESVAAGSVRDQIRAEVRQEKRKALALDCPQHQQHRLQQRHLALQQR